MTFKDQHGNWPTIVSSFLVLSAVFMILIGVLGVALVLGTPGPIIIGPTDPITLFFIRIQIPMFLILGGLLLAIVSRKAGQWEENRYREDLLGT